jgi:hypothetical protein
MEITASHSLLLDLDVLYDAFEVILNARYNGGVKVGKPRSWKIKNSLFLLIKQEKIERH